VAPHRSPSRPVQARGVDGIGARAERDGSAGPSSSVWLPRPGQRRTGRRPDGMPVIRSPRRVARTVAPHPPGTCRCARRRWAGSEVGAPYRTTSARRGRLRCHPTPSCRPRRRSRSRVLPDVPGSHEFSTSGPAAEKQIIAAHARRRFEVAPVDRPRRRLLAGDQRTTHQVDVVDEGEHHAPAPGRARDVACR